MFGIGIVDDEKERLESFVEDFKDVKDKNEIEVDGDDWETFPIVPFANLEDYPNWILENGITALVIDEKLRNTGATYDGHDLLDFLKPKFSWMPVYVVTGYASEDSLKERFEKATDIIEKNEWSRNRLPLAGRVVVSARDHSNLYETKHIALDELAEKVAKGEASPEEQRRLNALRDEIQLPFVEESEERDKWLGHFESSVAKLQEIVDKAKDRLGENN